MVQYFERQLWFAFTKHGWVQSFRAVCGRQSCSATSRPKPMTSAGGNAQSLTTPAGGQGRRAGNDLNWSFRA